MIIVHVNYAGVGAVLKSDDMKAMVGDAARAIQAALPATMDGDVVLSEVTEYTTDRAAAAVNLLDYRAISWQQKYGVLTQAAGAAGLEVTGG